MKKKKQPLVPFTIAAAGLPSDELETMAARWEQVPGRVFAISFVFIIVSGLLCVLFMFVRIHEGAGFCLIALFAVLAWAAGMISFAEYQKYKYTKARRLAKEREISTLKRSIDERHRRVS